MYWPVWIATPRRPWRLQHVVTGEWLRYPPKDNEHKAYSFHTAEDAQHFYERLSKKRKN